MNLINVIQKIKIKNLLGAEKKELTKRNVKNKSCLRLVMLSKLVIINEIDISTNF